MASVPSTMAHPSTSTKSKILNGSEPDVELEDGDLIIVQRQETAQDNAIVVALIDGEEATLKRLQHRPDGQILLLARILP